MSFLRAGLLFSVLFLVYFPALRGLYLWDDGRHVPNRPSFYTRTGLGLIWTQQGYTQQYYPLTFTTVWVEHHLWGGRPLGYHLVTLFFHGCNAILVALLLAELGFPAAWWVAFLFALHPIQVESVAWMTELKNTQSTFFYLLALLMLMRQRRPLHYVLAFLFYLCALASKTVSCTLPAVALILLWYRKDRVEKNDILGLVPFFGAGLCLALITSDFEKNILGAVGPAWDFSGYEHLLIAGRAFWFYVGKLFWPYPLNFTYPLWDAHHFKWPNVFFPVTVIVLFAALWVERRRRGKGPLAAVAIFAACLAPALGFVHLYPMRYSFVADHFQYQAGISMIALSVSAIWRLRRQARAAVLAVLCGIFGLLTWSRAHVFRDPETLYRDILSKNPNCLMAMDNLVVTLIFDGNIPEARVIVAKSLRMRPDDMDAQMQMGYLRLNYDHEPLAALPYFQQAYRQILDMAPSHSRQGYLMTMHAQLAETYFEAKQYGESEKLFHAALEEIPALRRQPFFDTTPEFLASSESDYRLRLAVMMEDEKKYREASDQLVAALRAMPGQVMVYQHLAEDRVKGGQPEQAADAYRQALALDAGNWEMHKRFADLLVHQGKSTEAAEEYRQALDFNPGSVDIADRLGALLLKLNRKQEALAVYQASVRVHPRHAQVIAP